MTAPSPGATLPARLQPVLEALTVAGRPVTARTIASSLGGKADTVSVVAGLKQLVDLSLAVEVPSDGPNTLFDIVREPKPEPRSGRGTKPSESTAPHPSVSAQIRAFLASPPHEFSMEAIQNAVGGEPARVANLVHAMVNKRVICRMGKGSTARFWLLDRSTAQPPQPSPNPSASMESSRLIDSLVQARRDADQRLRALALRSNDTELHDAARLASELQERVDGLIDRLRR